MKSSEALLLCGLRDAYEQGDLNREQFWQTMRDQHRRLAAYPPLLGKSEVAAIRVTDAGLTVELDSGLKFFWNPENLREPVSVAVNHGTYEPFEGRLLARCAERASLAVDAGANIGWHAIRMAANMTCGRVVAYEPVGETAAMLHANIALNGLADRITVVCGGLADRAGSGELFLPSDTGHVGASLRNLHPDEAASRVVVRLSTLDEAFPADASESLDLLKCDVEGAELSVLQGGRAVIERHRPVLFLELLRKWSSAFGYHPNEVIEWTRTFGYECWAAGTERLRRCEVIDDSTSETNFLFALPERDAAMLAEVC